MTSRPTTYWPTATATACWPTGSVKPSPLPPESRQRRRRGRRRYRSQATCGAGDVAARQGRHHEPSKGTLIACAGKARADLSRHSPRWQRSSGRGTVPRPLPKDAGPGGSGADLGWDVFRVPFPEVRVLGHPGLAATLLALLTGALAARHRDAAAGVVRGPGDGVVCSDEPGRPAVAGSHPAVGEASGHAFAKPARAGADHSIGADIRAVAGRIADEVVTDRALTASAAAAGASGIADTTAAGWIADTTGAA